MRSIRHLLLVVFTLAAFAALPAVASAANGLSLHQPIPTQLAAGQYPATLTGERLNEGPFVGKIIPFQAKDVTVSCQTAEFNGGKLNGPVTAFSLDASVSKCTDVNENAWTVNMNSCDYSYSDFAWIAEERFSAATAITCSGSDAIEVKFAGCSVKIPSQTLSGPTELENGKVSGESVISGETAGTGIEYTTEGFACYLIGLSKGAGKETHNNGSTQLHKRLKGIAS